MRFLAKMVQNSRKIYPEEIFSKVGIFEPNAGVNWPLRDRGTNNCSEQMGSTGFDIKHYLLTWQKS